VTIELYVFPPSPRAFKVMAMANHLGIDTTLHIIDLVKGGQKTPECAALKHHLRRQKNVPAHLLADARLISGGCACAA
jgi:hypothetical protein